MYCKHCGKETGPGWFQWIEHDAVCEKKPRPPEPIGSAEWCDWLEDQLNKATPKKNTKDAFEISFLSPLDELKSKYLRMELDNLQYVFTYEMETEMSKFLREQCHVLRGNIFRNSIAEQAFNDWKSDPDNFNRSNYPNLIV